MPVLLALLAPLVALALHPGTRTAPAAPPVYWDQVGVWQPEGFHVRDQRTGRVQCVANLAEGPFDGPPESAARAFLAAHVDWLNSDPAHLRVVRTLRSPLGQHVVFQRVEGDLPVYPGELVVSFDQTRRVCFFFSSLLDVPPTLLGPKPMVSATEARRRALTHLQTACPPRWESEADPVLWAGEQREVVPCWRFRFVLEEPFGSWEVLVDGLTGRIRRAEDRTFYLDGRGCVFRPDPVTTAHATYGDFGFVDSDDADSPELLAQRVAVALPDITTRDGGYYLEGPGCRIEDVEAPASPPVSAAHPDSFCFGRHAQGFEDVSCYYHITTSQNWVRELGFAVLLDSAILVDPHGFGGSNNSHYIWELHAIGMGEGGVDDAEDADIILHEYHHALLMAAVPSWGGWEMRALAEGASDYWGASYSASLDTFRAYWHGNWNCANPVSPSRVLNANLHYPEDFNAQGYHYSGQIWSQALWETRADVGRTVTDRIALQYPFLLAAGASLPAAALAVLTADRELYDGRHWGAIFRAFQPRGLLTILEPQHVTCRRVGDEIELRWQDVGAASYQIAGSARYDGPYEVVGQADSPCFRLPVADTDSVRFYEVKSILPD